MICNRNCPKCGKEMQGDPAISVRCAECRITRYASFETLPENIQKVIQEQAAGPWEFRIPKAESNSVTPEILEFDHE